MKLAKDFESIESLEFMVQFSVLSSFNSLRQAFAIDATVEALRSKLRGQPGACQSVAGRISQVLGKSDVELYDESIAAYLYCLSHEDRALAQKASEEILESGGLWWSVQLARRVIEMTETEAA
ncbi:MAG: hypothetical protein J4G18_18805 [Anaerolineae bacterium]|nr:hypothetical protein [Anaerolineae bacterium]